MFRTSCRVGTVTSAATQKNHVPNSRQKQVGVTNATEGKAYVVKIGVNILSTRLVPHPDVGYTSSKIALVFWWSPFQGPGDSSNSCIISLACFTPCPSLADVALVQEPERLTWSLQSGL